MATIQKGTVSTTEVLPDSMVIDMREEISMLDQDQSQFTSYLQKQPKRTCTREKVNWREKGFFPRLVTVGTAYINTATAIILTAGQGVRIRNGDVLRSMPAGDAMYVQSVATDTLTVTRNIGSKAAQAGSVGDTLLIMSNASPQGADFGQTAILLATLGYNYTQIVRHGYTFSRTAEAVQYYGRSEPAQESGLKGVEHKRAWEYMAFWGARGQITDPTTGEPVGFGGGLTEFIQTNRQNVAGALTVDALDGWLKNFLQFTGRNICLFTAPQPALEMSKFNRGGQGTAWRPEPTNVAGLQVDAFMSGVYGYEVPIVVKKDWNDFPTTLAQFGGWMFLVDLDRVSWDTLTGADTALLTNRAPRDSDRISEEYLTEGTFEIRNEQAHSIFYGIT